jgi:predicted O-methyltransferase YrrM
VRSQEAGENLGVLLFKTTNRAENTVGLNAACASSATEPYQFTVDWFTPNIQSFQRHLSGLKGKPCSILEIGCYEGRSSVWMLENIATTEDSRLLCLDYAEQPVFWSNIELANGRARTTLQLGLTRETLRGLPFGAYDFIYVDGSHGTIDVMEDAVLSFRLAKPGGIIAFDDYLWNDPKYNQQGTPKPAVDAFLAIYSAKLEILESGNQVWLCKREV